MKVFMKAQYKLGMVVSYIGFAISTIVGFILPPFLISRLGQELNGLYNTLTSFSVYFGMMDLGLGTAIIRFVAKYRADKKDYLIPQYMYLMRKVYCIICIVALVLGLVLTAYVPEIFNNSIPEGYERSACLVFIFGFLSIIVTIYDNLYYSFIKALEHFFISRSSAILRVIIRVSLIFILISIGYSVAAVAFADLLAALLIMLCRMYYCKRVLKLSFCKPSSNEIKLRSIFSFSLYVVIYSLVEKVFWQLDKVVLGIMSGGVAVTIYSVGAQISTSISSVSSTVSSMYLPHAVKVSSKDDRKKYTPIMAQMARYQMIVILPVFVGFCIFGNDFLRLWVGDGYEESYSIAIVLIATFIPVLLQSYGGALLKALNIQKIYAIAMVISVIMNIILTIALIPNYGSFGAAFASAIVNIIRCIFMAFYFQIKLSISIIDFLKYSMKGFIAETIIISAFGIFLNYYLVDISWLTLLFKIGIFSLVYLFSIYWILLNAKEKEIVISIKRKVFRV